MIILKGLGVKADSTNASANSKKNLPKSAMYASMTNNGRSFNNTQSYIYDGSLRVHK